MPSNHCPPWCTDHHGYPLDDLIHTTTVAVAELGAIEIHTGIGVPLSAALLLDDGDERLEHLDAVRLRRLAAGLLDAADLLDPPGCTDHR